MICPVSDGRRRGLRRSVAAAWRASGHQVFSEESELPERPVEGHHERDQKRQVIPATFCDFFWDFHRDRRPAAWRGLPSAFAAACCVGLSGSRMRLAARNSPPASRRPSQPAPIRSRSAARWQCSPIRQRSGCRAMQVRRGTPLQSSRRLRDPSSLTVSIPVTASRCHPAGAGPARRGSAATARAVMIACEHDSTATPRPPAGAERRQESSLRRSPAGAPAGNP